MMILMFARQAFNQRVETYFIVKFSAADVNSEILKMTVRLFWCNFSSMTASRKKKDVARPVFDSIRKPIAPPSRKFGKPKPEEKAHPTLRKTKHKKKTEAQD